MIDVISIQSQVVYGHVGNSAAVFPMQAKGLEVAAVPTALLSNHPRYPTVHGQMLDPELIAGLLQGIEERGVLDTARIIVTGYLSSADNTAVVAAFVERAQQRHPQLVYVCDPVMGDDDLGVFVKPALRDAFRERLVPMATIVTPNQFELELLTGRKARTLAGLDEAMTALGGGAISAAVTGCVLDDTAPGSVETITWSPQGTGRTTRPRLPIRPCGTGDLFTGLMTSRLWAGESLAEAGAGATEEIFAILQRTQAVGAGETCIVGFPFAATS